MKRYVIVLMFASLSFFLLIACDLSVMFGEEEDDPTCEDAVNNAYSEASVETLCETGYEYGDFDYDEYQECLDQSKSDLDEDLIKEVLIEWCEEEWEDSDIKCHNDADSDEDVRDCADLDSGSGDSGDEEYW